MDLEGRRRSCCTISASLEHVDVLHACKPRARGHAPLACMPIGISTFLLAALMHLKDAGDAARRSCIGRLSTPPLEMARGRLAAFKVGLCHHTDLGAHTALRQTRADIRLHIVRFLYTAVRLSVQKLPTADPSSPQTLSCGSVSQLTTQAHQVLCHTVGLTLPQPPAFTAASDLRSLQYLCDCL